MLEIGISEGDRILDLGCGLGDLYGYIQSVGLDVQYTGIDINADLVNAARNRFPETEFIVGDIQNENIGAFDYVVSSSCFNLKLQQEDNYEFVEALLAATYRCARKGVAIDFLTSYVDFRGNPTEAFYYEPERVFAIAKKITRRVTLRHDYPLFEFFVYLYPNFEGWHRQA